jgi:signal transduction histidine kinase
LISSFKGGFSGLLFLFDPKDMSKVFGLFQRLKGSSDYPGTGMGLAITKRAVERMGGRIGVESKPELEGKYDRHWDPEGFAVLGVAGGVRPRA